MKRFPDLIFLVLLLLVIPAKSFGEMHDGNILLEDCKQFLKFMENKDDSSLVMSSIGYCLGYMQGHIDFQHHLDTSSEKAGHCVPVDVSVSQLAKIAVDYLEKNPDKLNKPAFELTRSAFVEAFSCADPL